MELKRILGYHAYLEMATTKAQKMAQSLARLIPNVRGPNGQKRKLLATVVLSKLLYVSPIWAKSIVSDRHFKALLRPQKTMALRAVRLYRTVSMAVVMVIAGTVPAHLYWPGKR